MNRILIKSGIAAVSAAVLLSGTLCGCGKKTASQTGENIVPVENSEQNNSENKANYEVKLDERTRDTQYSYGEDDISLVDTVSGKKIVLGMSETDIESIAGEPSKIDGSYKIYDGVVVRYGDGKAVSFIVANGQFEGAALTRYKSSRGVGVGTSAEDFKKAYGDSYTEGSETVDEKTGNTEKNASRAVRYFKKDGSDMEFLGTRLTDEQKSGDTSNYYLQDFMFSNADGKIATIRVSLLSAAAGGI